MDLLLDNDFTKVSKSELKSSIIVPLICGCIQKNGTKCTAKPTFQHKNKPDMWRCGKHIKTSKSSKNTLHSREGSWRYATAMSLHIANSNVETTVEYSDTCFYCKTKLDKTTKKATDHIFPVIIKGQPTQKIINSKNNKVICCSICNSQKGNKDPLQWVENKNFGNEVKDSLQKKIKNIPTFTNEVFGNIIFPKFNKAIAIIHRVAVWVSEPGNDPETEEIFISDIKDILHKN
jgi:5-methylcytosine-specific restriction endonuclease McrA